MKKIMLIVNLIVMCVLANAQTHKMIYSSNASKPSDSVNRLLDKSDANSSASLVNIDINKIKDSDELILEFSDLNYTVEKSKIQVRGINNFTFTGVNKDDDGSIIMSVLDGDIQGTITKGNEVFKIETLGKEYFVVKMDHSVLKEKCNELLENQYDNNHIHEDDAIKNDENDFSKLRSVAIYDCKIRVLVLFTPAAASSVSNIKNTILLAIDETNQSFINSGINYEVELVYIEQTNYIEANISTDLSRFSTNGDGYMDEVHSLRAKYSADVCMLVNDDDIYCGVADAIGATSSSAFAVVKAYNCATGYYSFGHEIGHLLGCRHDTYVDPNTTPFSYGHGYVSPSSSWRTIMAYSYACSGCSRIPYWSNPNVTYGGVAMGTVSTNNNARVWNEVSPYIMTFEQPDNSVSISSTDVSNNLYADIIAKEDISTSGTVNISNGHIVAMRAGESVTLQPGFFRELGTNFTASIETISNCGTSSSRMAMNNSDNSFESLNEFNVTAYPNPTSELVNIEYVLPSRMRISIDLIDFLGQRVKTVTSETMQDMGTHTSQVSVSELSIGTYFLKITFNDDETLQKVIVN